MEESIFVEIETKARYLRRSLLKAVLEKMFRFSKGCSTINIKMATGDGLEFCCFPVMVSYHCDIPQGKDVWSVKHGLLVRKLCICCLALPDDVQWLQMARRRTTQDTKSWRELFRECTEKFICTEGNNKKKINMKRKRAG